MVDIKRGGCSLLKRVNVAQCSKGEDEGIVKGQVLFIVHGRESGF